MNFLQCFYTAPGVTLLNQDNVYLGRIAILKNGHVGFVSGQAMLAPTELELIAHCIYYIVDHCVSKSWEEGEAFIKALTRYPLEEAKL